MGYSALIVTIISSIAILLSLVIYNRLFPQSVIVRAHEVVASYKSISDRVQDKRYARRAKSMSFEYSRSLSLLRRAFLVKILLILTMYTTLLLIYSIFIEPLVPSPFAIPFLTIASEDGYFVSTTILHFLIFMKALILFRESLK